MFTLMVLLFTAIFMIFAVSLAYAAFCVFCLPIRHPRRVAIIAANRRYFRTH